MTCSVSGPSYSRVDGVDQAGQHRVDVAGQTGNHIVPLPLVVTVTPAMASTCSVPWATLSVAATGSASSPGAEVTLTPVMACEVFSSSTPVAPGTLTDGVSDTGLTVIATVWSMVAALGAAPGSVEVAVTCSVSGPSYSRVDGVDQAGQHRVDVAGQAGNRRSCRCHWW